MTTYTLLVTVEVERESGLHASRDEIIEVLENAVTEAVESAEVSGLGPRSDSDYALSDVAVEPLMSKRELKALQDYDALAAADYPGDAALRKELKEEREARQNADRALHRASRTIENLMKAIDEKKTSVWYGGRFDDEPVHYLPERERVFWQYGEDHHERFAVQWSDWGDGSIEVRTDTMGRDLAVVPLSGNVVRLRMVEREPLGSHPVARRRGR